MACFKILNKNYANQYTSVCVKLRKISFITSVQILFPINKLELKEIKTIIFQKNWK
jgi:hypothetical protein